MNKFLRALAISLTAVCTLSILGGCGGGGGSEQTTLRVYNWGDYIDLDVLDAFKAENPDINVIYDTFDSNEAMLAKLDGGSQYDILFPSDYMVERLIAEDKLAKLDMSQIPNYANIDDKFKNLDYDPNNEYSVPYTFGTLGILYDTTKVTEPVDSWGILFDEKYKGQIVMYDSVRDSMAVALKYLGSSCNERDEAKVQAAGDLLKKQKPLVQSYQTDVVKETMISGSAAMAVVYSGDAVLCMDENENLAYVVPKEGSNYFVDAVAVSKTCENMDAAYRFINYLCDVDVAAKNCEYIGYSTPSTAALQKMGQEYIDDPAYNPDEQTLKKCEVYLDLGEMTAIYNKIWENIRYGN